MVFNQLVSQSLQCNIELVIIKQCLHHIVYLVPKINIRSRFYELVREKCFFTDFHINFKCYFRCPETVDNVTSPLEMQQINDFFEIYAKALENYDTKGLAYMYTTPCTMLSDDSTAFFNDPGKLEGFFKGD